MKKLLIIMLVALFGFTTLVNAQDKSYSNEPGYFDFAKYGDHSEEDLMTEVHLGAHLLKMASKATKHNEEEISTIIAGLKLIKVNIYSVGENKNDVADQMNKMNKALRGDNWERIVMSREDGNIAYVFIKTVDDRIAGLVVTAYEKPEFGDEGQAVYVNIVGDIDLEKIGELSSKFDIPNLDKVNQRDHDDD